MQKSQFMSDTSSTRPYYVVPKCNQAVILRYIDHHLLVVEKPTYLLSVPGREKENKDCVITRVQTEFPSACMVHRLDLDTSGLLIFALTPQAQRHINRQFQMRTIKKTYIAELWGIIETEQGKIDLPIAADWENRPRQKICANGKASLTHYRVLHRDTSNYRTRVSLHPETGRSHQLRIHTKHIGHPILGCDLYAHDEALAASPRLLLHASELILNHPITEQRIRIRSTATF